MAGHRAAVDRVPSAWQGGRWRGPVATMTAALVLAAGTVYLFTRPAAALAADGVVSLHLAAPVNSFGGSPYLGAGIDGLEAGEIAKVWTRDNIAAMRSAGYGSISYRLRTELGVKAWHWNPQGTWSDPAGKQGYWTSATTLTDDPGVSYGYHLPRRGNTIDQANNDGYSRLADGDATTFWKSNPYLDGHFTKEPDANHPQWILAAFDGPVPVDQVRISWGTPYATRFRVQYWTGEDALFPAQDGPVAWKDFPAGVHPGRGGDQTVKVATDPVKVQFVRVLMTADSDTAPPGGTGDVRDRLGYAVREIAIGHDAGDGFVDHVEHAATQDQTTMYASSTDPWHRESDLDPDYEHASFARTYASGLTAGQPMMVPVPALYGTPDDAAALLSYLRAHDYPVRRVEVGEEPDGQLAQPEDYAALYLQVAAAMKAVDPEIEFGGPGYQTVLPDWYAWPDANGVRSWTGRFVSYLKARERLDDLDFFSFEWYPFDDVCGDQPKQIAQHPALLSDLMRRQEAAGLPPDVPKVITEYGYSSFAGQVELELPGAILNAETAAHFLTLGGETSYFYGLEPNWVFQEDEGKPCDTWGNLMLFQFFDDFRIRPIATFHASQLVTRHWAQPGTGRHEVYTASSDLRTADGDPAVTAYPVRRPDGRLAVLLFNKDPRRAYTVRLADGARPLPGRLEIRQYSGKQWDWEPRAKNRGRPERNDPPERWFVTAGAAATVTLPPYSISLVRTAAPVSGYDPAPPS